MSQNLGSGNNPSATPTPQKKTQNKTGTLSESNTDTPYTSILHSSQDPTSSSGTPLKFNSEFTPEKWWDWKTIRLPIGSNGNFSGAYVLNFGRVSEYLKLIHTSIPECHLIGGAEGYHGSMKRLGCHRRAYFWCHAPRRCFNNNRHKSTAPRERDGTKTVLLGGVWCIWYLNIRKGISYFHFT